MTPPEDIFMIREVASRSYGRALAMPENYKRLKTNQTFEDMSSAMKSVVADTEAYDWEGDEPLHQPFAKTLIYEMHVRGFTRHPNSGVAKKNGEPMPG